MPLVNGNFIFDNDITTDAYILPNDYTILYLSGLVAKLFLHSCESILSLNGIIKIPVKG